MKNSSIKINAIQVGSAFGISGGIAASFSCCCMCCSDTDGRSLNFILP